MYTCVQRKRRISLRCDNPCPTRNELFYLFFLLSLLCMICRFVGLKRHVRNRTKDRHMNRYETYSIITPGSVIYKTENNIYYCQSQILRCGLSVQILVLRNASLSSACNMICSHFSIPFPGIIHSFSNIPFYKIMQSMEN